MTTTKREQPPTTLRTVVELAIVSAFFTGLGGILCNVGDTSSTKHIPKSIPYQTGPELFDQFFPKSPYCPKKIVQPNYSSQKIGSYILIK